MAKDRRARQKGRRSKRPFLGLPKDVLGSPAYRSLGGWEVKLLVDIGGQFNGKNNGDLCAAWSVMKERGWKSPGTLSKALKGLLEVGLIQETREGGRHRCTLYALTWEAIDECRGKLDVGPTNTPSNRFKDYEG
ncbi:hypothetical protein C8D92_102229 [Tamilnaduibacter salinus]|uniref:Uncharacterized protein n=1 Tax=Tamilnaduibacter salinus TaxID=1484056 RepID=A0A2A2I0R7_9GAMM|nr:hypothetical protein [Tamilnaduibacter salinus]PAV25202.1 hypothetical protein CF392_12250 [Tamilnaduibacter salinus]PVY78189.1 hypothetical protein C8D92_102229 [Tamilnaduibacter salinus]